MPASGLLQIHRAARKRFPDWWIGVNCLDLTPAQVFEAIPDDVSGIWVDNALIDERMDRQPDAEAVQSIRQTRGWPGLYFGGVAFKYQRAVSDVARAARVAAGCMDVVTTSGPATGQPAHRQKIAAMKAAIGQKPLAIASGISPDNVVDYLDLADCFLVATAVSRRFSELDPTLVAKTG